MIINEAEYTIDFSENPTCVLDEVVLARLREALDNNSRFSHLVFDNNRLTDEAIAILMAILKGNAPIESLSFCSCKLRDVDLMHIITAVCSKKMVRFIDLSRNPGITSASVPDIARLIRNARNLKTLLMKGTSLHSVGCSNILAALESNPSMRELELPYTVGFKVLDRIGKIIRMKDEAIHEPPTNGKSKQNVALPSSLVPNGDGVKTSTSTREVGSFPKLLLPPFERASTELQSLTPRLYHSCKKPGTSEFRHWADPAVKNAMLHLQILDKRCHLLEVHKQQRNEQIRARRGLLERRGNTGVGLAYRL